MIYLLVLLKMFVNEYYPCMHESTAYSPFILKVWWKWHASRACRCRRRHGGQASALRALHRRCPVVRRRWASRWGESCRTLFSGWCLVLTRHGAGTDGSRARFEQWFEVVRSAEQDCSWLDRNPLIKREIQDSSLAYCTCTAERIRNTMEFIEE